MTTKGERYREILAVLARHDIALANDELIKHEAGDQARAKHLRQACEGAELAKLQNDVPPLPEHVIADVIREDLGAAPETIFAAFDQTPLGSASIGQVHAARLFDGREVVVKVRKPGVDALVAVDLDILTRLLAQWSPRFPVLVEYDAGGIVAEFSNALRGELDYAREAASVRFFQAVFKNEVGFKIPDVIDEYSKNRVLTEERVTGRKASDVATLPKLRLATVCRRIVRFVLEPAFERGVFHADPHPGNLLVQDDDTLCVIDFGKTGHLTPEQRRRVADIFIAIDRSDALKLTDRLNEITAPTHPIDRALMTAEVDRMLQLYVTPRWRTSMSGTRWANCFSSADSLACDCPAI